MNASYFQYHAHCALAFGDIFEHGFLVSIVCMFCPNAISVYILMSEFII